MLYRVPGSIGTSSELTRARLLVEQLLMYCTRRPLKRIKGVSPSTLLQQLAQDFLSRSREGDDRKKILPILEEVKRRLELRESDCQLLMSGLRHDPPRAV